MADDFEPNIAAERKTVNFSLQGGALMVPLHGGVLDRLLEDGRIANEGGVGTSAGAMNAAITAYGLVEGGNDGARVALRRFWQSVAAKGIYSALQPTWFDRMVAPGNMVFSPVWLAMDFMSRMCSPYQMNPTNFHPLREILDEQIDFELMRRSRNVKLFVCGTNGLTNRLRVFGTPEITLDAVLASACLPSVFHAIPINGEDY